MNLRRCVRLLPLFVAGIACAGGPLAAAPQADIPRIIFDSDMSSDWDDVGDIAVLHGLASMGECRILAMMVSSQNGGTPLLMDAINTFYGKPDIPIGVRPDIGGVGMYAGQIAAEFPHDLKSASECPLAVNLYRQVLALQPDHSVTIVTTGYLNNLQALLLSGPDQHSPLNGMDLVRKKVKLFSCAGGCFPSGSEFNLRVEPAAAHHVVNHWPTAALYVGYDVGQAIYTGGRLPEAPAKNPIRRVYVDIQKSYPYPSWGQIAIYAAVRATEAAELWGVHAVGRNTCTPDGSNAWSTDRDPTGAQDQGYLLEKARTPVRAGLDAMIMLPPNDGSPSRPGEPSHVRAAASGDNRIDLQWTDNAYNESGFRIERRINGVYTQVATVGANVTRYSDRDLSSTANAAYRVKAYNAVGDSPYSCVWVYSGWTEINHAQPGNLPLYTYTQHSSLRWGRGGDFRPDHVALNDDSSHGRDVTIRVDVTALGHEGTFYVYFFYQDANNWYRLNVGESAGKFEKRIQGVITPIGSPAPVPNIGNGTNLRAWRIEAAASGTLRFTSEGSTVLQVSEPLSLDGGRIGLGGVARTPVWENFHFDAAGGAPDARR